MQPRSFPKNEKIEKNRDFFRKNCNNRLVNLIYIVRGEKGGGRREWRHENSIENGVAFWITQEAAKRRLGVLLGAYIAPWITEMYEKLGQDIRMDGKHLVFHLSESMYYCNCDKLFAPIYYEKSGDRFYVMGVKLACSRLPDVQDFFVEMMRSPVIASIYTIQADDFCRAINVGFRKQDTENPAIRLIIV